MVIFGGIHEVTKELDDMYLYDFRNSKWYQLYDEISNIEKKRTYPSSPLN